MTNLTEKTYIGGAGAVNTSVSNCGNQSKTVPALSNMDLQDMGNLIKSLRKLRNWRQADLSDKSGVPIRSIQRLEYGENVGLDIFLKLLNTLEIGFKPVDLKEFVKK